MGAPAGSFSIIVHRTQQWIFLYLLITCKFMFLNNFEWPKIKSNNLDHFKPRNERYVTLLGTLHSHFRRNVQKNVGNFGNYWILLILFLFRKKDFALRFEKVHFCQLHPSSPRGKSWSTERHMCKRTETYVHKDKFIKIDINLRKNILCIVTL